MRAGSRLGRVAAIATAIVCAPTVAGAQETPAPTTNTPANETIGPRELQNFSLEGTRTRPVPTDPTPAPAPAQRTSPAPAQRSAPGTTSAPSAQAQPRTAAPQVRPTERTVAPAAEPPPPASPMPDLPAFNSVTPAQPTPNMGQQFDQPAPVVQPKEAWPLLPWLAVLLAALGAGAFLLWRKRSGPQLAPAGGFDDQQAAGLEPTPPPRPRPAEPEPAPPSPPLERQLVGAVTTRSARAAAAQPLVREPAATGSTGLVSARLRPSVEIGFEPVRCIMDDELITIQFRIDLFNSGNAPARAVLAEANLFNAGPEQDQQIGSFFANPVGQGERIEAIAPLKRIVLTTQISARRDQLQQFEAAGRKLAVLIIGFNALYSWAGGAGQTSAAYLLGRKGSAEKMAPFRVDIGSRTFTDLEARPLPIHLRR